MQEKWESAVLLKAEQLRALIVAGIEHSFIHVCVRWGECYSRIRTDVKVNFQTLVLDSTCHNFLADLILLSVFSSV